MLSNYFVQQVIFIATLKFTYKKRPSHHTSIKYIDSGMHVPTNNQQIWAPNSLPEQDKMV
jgi:hypothetical protein